MAQVNTLEAAGHTRLYLHVEQQQCHYMLCRERMLKTPRLPLSRVHISVRHNPVTCDKFKNVIEPQKEEKNRKNWALVW